LTGAFQGSLRKLCLSYCIPDERRGNEERILLFLPVPGSAGCIEKGFPSCGILSAVFRPSSRAHSEAARRSLILHSFMPTLRQPAFARLKRDGNTLSLS
jgi:hypothetical protein